MGVKLWLNHNPQSTVNMFNIMKLEYAVASEYAEHNFLMPIQNSEKMETTWFWNWMVHYHYLIFIVAMMIYLLFGLLT